LFASFVLAGRHCNESVRFHGSCSRNRRKRSYIQALFGVAPTSTRSTAGAGASNSSFASVRLKQLRLLYSMPKTAPLCPALYAAVSRAAPNRPKISQVSWQLDILKICLRFPQVTSSIICHFCSFITSESARFFYLMTIGSCRTNLW
jgi:hypothetical protein